MAEISPPQTDNALLTLISSDGLSTIIVRTIANDAAFTQEEANDYRLSEDFKTWFEQNSNIDSFKAEPDLINGISVVRTTYIETVTNSEGENSFKGISIMVVKDFKTIFHIVYSSLPEDFDKNLVESEKIINTFKLIGFGNGANTVGTNLKSCSSVGGVCFDSCGSNQYVEASCINPAQYCCLD